MRIYWYWPFARPEELTIAPATPREGDHLLVHTLDRASAPAATSHDKWVLERALPEVSDVGPRVMWAASRTRTYVARSAIRSRAVRTYRPDIAHIMFLNYFTDPVALPRLRRRVALLSTVHDAVPHVGRLTPRVETAVLRRLYRASGHLLAHHAHVKARLVGDFGVPADQVDVIPLQIPSFPNRDVPPPDSRRILFFGTFRRNKGVDVLLSAIKQLRGEDDIDFVLAGQPDDFDQATLHQAAAADPRIRLELGWITPERKSELYSEARLVVLPYTSFASQSGVLNDAYGHRRPVVVTDTGALGETVREDGTGWVVAPGDAQDLATSILAALGDDAAYTKAVESCRRVVRGRSPLEVARQLRSLYARTAT